MQKITGNQPQPVRQRIYGSVPVVPLEGASNQPEVLSHTKVYGNRHPSTVRVTLKDGGKELIINQSDFDENKHDRLTNR